MRIWRALLTLSLASLGRGDEVRRRQEHISQAFIQRLGQLADRAEQQQVRVESGRNLQGFAPWQSAFSAANDAFKVFQRYETLRNIQRKEPTTEEPRLFEVVRKSQFVAFEAVPNIPTTDIKKELPVKIELIKDEPVVEYIPFNANFLKESQPLEQFVWNVTSTSTETTAILTTTSSTFEPSTTPNTTISTTISTPPSTTTTSTTATITTTSTTTATSSTTTATTSTLTTTSTITTTTSTQTMSSPDTTITPTTASTTTGINKTNLEELLDEIFVSYDQNLNELLGKIIVPTASTSSTNHASTSISTKTISTKSTANQGKATTQKSKNLVDLILSNVFKLTSDVDTSGQTTNLWEFAESYEPTSTISTTKYKPPPTKRTTTTITTSTTTTTTTSTTTPKKDLSLSSQNQNTKQPKESRESPLNVVIDPHGLEFYFPDVLSLFFGSE